MTTQDLSELSKMTEAAMALIVANGQPEPIDLAALGQAMKHVDPTFSPQKYGAEKLRPLLEALPNLSIVKDDSIFPPRYFAERRGVDKAAAPSPMKAESSAPSRRKGLDGIDVFAWVKTSQYGDLAAMALPEEWSPPWGDRGEQFSLLRSYLNFTYIRLKFEKKIEMSLNGDCAAFNTGLVDERYSPIYASFSKNPNEGAQEWKLDGFCIAGEDFLGKSLVRNFKSLPEAAYYFSDPADAIYDIRQGEPIVDWDHVVVENPDRIPVELLRKAGIKDFEVKNCREMTKADLDSYKQAFEVAINGDKLAYRMIIQAYKGALEVALKKVRWNYKTAIPVYFPRLHRMSLLLPLAVVSDDKIDVALVVERTQSGHYQGHTTYPLEWAYSNARLICRPESDWLSVDGLAMSAGNAAGIAAIN